MLRSAGSNEAQMFKSASKVCGLALDFRAAFLSIVAVAMFYGSALLTVVYAYRKAYGIVGRPELAVRFTAQCLAGVHSRVCSQTHIQRTIAAMVNIAR
jgi:hypothetical protein